MRAHLRGLWRLIFESRTRVQFAQFIQFVGISCVVRFLWVIERRVEESDSRLAAAHRRVEDPAIASDAAALQEALAELERARQENDALYARWAELTEKAG